MPVSESIVKSKANDYKSWFLLAAAGIGIIIILAIAVVIYAVMRSNQSVSNSQTTNVPAGSLAAVNVTSPSEAVVKLNSNLTNAIKNIPDNNPNAAAGSILNALIGNNASASTAHFGFTYAMTEGANTVNVEFTGNVISSDSKPSLQGTANITANTKETPNLVVPVDIVLSNNHLFIKINHLDKTLPGDYAFLNLLEGKFLKIDLESYLALPGMTSSDSTKDLLDSTKRQETIDLWTANPPLINARSAADRKAGEVTLKCMQADLNPKAFKDSGTAESYPPVEICSDGDKAPVYVGVDMTKDGQRISVGLTIYSFGEPTTIVEPVDDVVDLSGLLGSNAN